MALIVTVHVVSGTNMDLDLYAPPIIMLIGGACYAVYGILILGMR